MYIHIWSSNAFLNGGNLFLFKFNETSFSCSESLNGPTDYEYFDVTGVEKPIETSKVLVENKSPEVKLNNKFEELSSDDEENLEVDENNYDYNDDEIDYLDEDETEEEKEVVEVKETKEIIILINQLIIILLIIF